MSSKVWIPSGKVVMSLIDWHLMLQDHEEELSQCRAQCLDASSADRKEVIEAEQKVREMEERLKLMQSDLSSAHHNLVQMANKCMSQNEEIKKLQKLADGVREQ